MKVSTIAILAAILLIASACVVRVNKNYKKSHIVADGNIETETHKLSPFTQIQSSIPADIIFVQTEEEPHLVIMASKNIIPYFSCEVENKELQLEFRSDSIASFTAGEIKVTVYGKAINKVTLSGSGDFDAESLSCEGDFSLSLEGSGDIDIVNISCDNCELALSGSGDIELSGSVKGKVTAALAGSGDVSLSGEAAEAELSIAGSGDIDIRDLKVSGAVNYQVAGSGKVHQKTDPS